jgi:dolichol-phosphate mannosyltransferase
MAMVSNETSQEHTVPTGDLTADQPPGGSPHGHRRRVVVTIPTYNEKDTIADMIAAVLAEQANVDLCDLHVLVSDSHSSDGTLDIVGRLSAEHPNVHLLDVEERGIGIGLYRGMRHAVECLDAEILVEMDADFQHNPEDIPAFLQQILEGYDLVVGSRFIAGSLNRMPFYRKILSIAANQMIRIMLGLRGITEMTTSYRAFTRETFLAVDPESVPWQERSFIPVPVFLVRMLESGARFVEVPITMHPRTRGYSKMVYWQYIRDILLFSIRSRLGAAKK